ncbi:MAG: DUF2062 domain-containing protein [Paracoccaceae bacterium]
MVFKRRDPRPPLRAMWEFIHPPGGWGRAFHYVKHRVRRLPDTPERISRGIWAGVFVCFSPLFGLHFLFAAGIARLMKGNILASLMATFFGNPLTYLPIAIVSLETGHLLLGKDSSIEVDESLGHKFVEAWRDLKHNVQAMFTDDVADWDGLHVFYNDVFLPYLVGGLIPGVIAATVCYMLSLPLIRAYQNGRRRKIRAKFEAIKKKAAQEMERDAKHGTGRKAASGHQH